MDQAIEGLLVTTGEWVKVAEWSSKDAEYDAIGWLEEHAMMIGAGIARLPIAGAIDLRTFAAIRAA